MANGISYQLNLDNAGFQRGLGEARSAVSGFSSLVRPQMMMVAASVAGAALAVKGISTAFREARAAVGEAANRETMETAFIPLLGSAKAARERMAELADFAAHTPFQLPGIAARPGRWNPSPMGPCPPGTASAWWATPPPPKTPPSRKWPSR